MRRSLSFSIGLTGLISILLVSLSPASASVLSKAAPSSPLAGMVAAQGRLVGAGGSAVPGARVILYAWPPDSIVSKLKDGQLVPVRTVGTALTTASGNYAVPVTSSAALQDSAAADGIVNLELIASTPTGFAAFSFPRRLIETAQGTALIGASGNAVQAFPQTTNLRLTHAAASSVPSIQCGQLVKVGTFGQRRTVVGAMYSHVPGVTMNFRYGSSREQPWCRHIRVGEFRHMVSVGYPQCLIKQLQIFPPSTMRQATDIGRSSSTTSSESSAAGSRRRPRRGLLRYHPGCDPASGDPLRDTAGGFHVRQGLNVGVYVRWRCRHLRRDRREP